jgi:hypothetical protein
LLTVVSVNVMLNFCVVTIEAEAVQPIPDQTAVPDQTTLIAGAEAFALGPIDATTLGKLTATYLMYLIVYCCYTSVDLAVCNSYYTAIF